MGRKYFLLIIFLFIIAVIFSGAGCASNNDISVKYLYGLSEAEKKDALAYLGKYIQVLEAPPMKTMTLTAEEEDQISQQINQENPAKLPNSLEFSAIILDEISDVAYLREIRGKYSPASQNVVTHDIHSIDTAMASRLIGMMNESKKNFLYAETTRFDKLINIASSRTKENISTGYVESYFHYMTKDGQEKRIVKPGQGKSDFDLRLIGRIQPESEIVITYTANSCFPRKGKPIHILGSEGVAALKEESFLKFSCEGKTDIPKNGTIVMECRPNGSNLTEAEKGKRLFVFITCAINDNTIKATESTMTPNK